MCRTKRKNLAPPRFEREPDVVLDTAEFAERRDKLARMRVGTLILAGESFIERVDARRYHKCFAAYAEQPELF